MQNYKTAILSTVINFDLYSKSALFFPGETSKIVIDGRNGMHGIDSICYMMKKFGKEDIDWLIMADEDVLFVKPNVVFDIIAKMEQENYMFCGVKDGGVIRHRNYNPYAINTFFSVLNFKELKKIWNQKEMLSHQYWIGGEFDDDLSTLPHEYDMNSLYEPYYSFYFWLRRKGKKVLFLDADHPFEDDNITNSVCFNDEVLLYHTWYARSYQINEKHTRRIDAVLNVIGDKIENETLPIVIKDKTFTFRKSAKKFTARIKMKMKKWKK